MMKRAHYVSVMAACGVLVGIVACGHAKKAEVEVDQAKLKMFRPLPAVVESPDNPITPEKIALGRMLYYEPRLSKGQDVSCNSCHGLNTYGVDGKPVSEGHRGAKGNRNSPTVYGAAGHFAAFWDGRAANVEEQAKGPVLNPVEMAMASEKQVAAVLTSMPEYVEAFRKAFPEQKNPVTFDNMAKAIGAFERKLVTPGRWDKFLQGDQTALTGAEKAGFNKFMEAGCQSCHNGAYIGGGMFQKLGLVKPWENTQDLGRYEVTRQDSDKMVFKVPSLRDIAKTGPYYHDGSIATLDNAVKTMAECQLGRALTNEDLASIVTWLNSLTGELPLDYIKPPELPKSTPKTPKPGLT